MTDRNIALKFGALLRKHRKGAKLTQEQLAKQASLTPEHIQRLEGKTPSGVRLETIVRLAKVLKVHPSILLKEI